MKISDNTLSELVARRLVALRAYQLFGREFGRDAFVSVHRFTSKGKPVRVSRLARTLALALAGVFAELDPAGDTEAETQLLRRFAGVRVFQFFARKLGPEDVVYVSAWAKLADDNFVECRASAMKFDDALSQLLQNLDQATAPEEPFDGEECHV